MGANFNLTLMGLLFSSIDDLQSCILDDINEGRIYLASRVSIRVSKKRIPCEVDASDRCIKYCGSHIDKLKQKKLTN